MQGSSNAQRGKTIHGRCWEECMGPPITRRSVVIGGAAATALVAGLPLPVAAQETVTVDQFRALSARLTGAAVSDLDAAMAGKLLDAFLSMGREPALRRLAADRGLSAGPVADDIVAAWYSGTYKLPRVWLLPASPTRFYGTPSISPNRPASAVARPATGRIRHPDETDFAWRTLKRM